MLEMIREYAKEQLDHSGDCDALLSKLAGYLIEIVRPKDRHSSWAGNPARSRVSSGSTQTSAG
jgi:hypothetical protein